ncbi:plasmid replication protein RepC [Paracoccus litorisediminis]|uniref:plasmid replication protein RepC n=1 Tax=Paracoccus litorisediminis TaxID=2006130 RepID=UPI0037349E4D
MDYIPLSPFMRPISYGRIQGQNANSRATKPHCPQNKWELFRELSKAKASFALSERDLTVLQGLISFFPHDELADGTEMVVFPSNKSICERLNGMADSTMRRHLANLISAGIIARRDSPNGKRYCRNDKKSRIAFGFDLSPLLHRSVEIRHAADTARQSEEEIKRLREALSLMRRDLIALAAHGATIQPELYLWADIHELVTTTNRQWRRKLALEELRVLQKEFSLRLTDAKQALSDAHAAEMNSSAVQNEQHYHNTKKRYYDSELAQTQNRCRTENRSDHIDEGMHESSTPTGYLDMPPATSLPLHLVAKSCPTVQTFYDEPIETWSQLHKAACFLSTSMGINRSVWEEAQQQMGKPQASVVLAAMLERFSEIRSPGAYLRSLSAKAKDGKFSCVPMIAALLRQGQVA